MSVWVSRCMQYAHMLMYDSEFYNSSVNSTVLFMPASLYVLVRMYVPVTLFVCMKMYVFSNEVGLFTLIRVHFHVYSFKCL